jgi:GDP-4-dehydro-6-deoxy-D-mannose reductase
MIVLITGAAGFTARHLSQRLGRESGITVVGTDIHNDRPALGTFNDYFQVDLTDEQVVKDLLQQVQPDQVYHLAGLFRGSTELLYRVNLTASLHLLEAMRTLLPDSALLMVGSAAEYGIWPTAEMPLAEDHPCAPVNAYGASKLAMTEAARLYHRVHGLRVVVARPFNLIGAGMPETLVAGAIIARICSSLGDQDPVITVGNTASERDFVNIDDAVDAYISMLEAEAWGEVFNISSGTSNSIQEVLDTLVSFAAQPIRVERDESLVRANDPPLITGDCSKARDYFGYAPSMDLNNCLRAAWNEAASAILQKKA